MTAVLYTLPEALRYLRNPTLDHAYRDTRLGASITAYLAWKRLSGAAARTLDQYERDLARLAVRTDADVADITVEDLMLVLEMFPPGSWKRVRAAWSDFFKWATITGKRSATNPVQLLPKSRPTPEPVYDIFTKPELAAIVNAARSMKTLPVVNEIRALLLTETGMRAGGAINLRVRDVNLYTREVLLREKGGKSRLVPIRGEVVNAFDRYKLTKYPLLNREPLPDDYLWFPRDASGIGLTAIYPDRPLKYGAFREWWVKLCERADVNYRSPHMARHTFATHLLNATEGRTHAVKHLLGHAHLDTTEIYLHSTTEHMNAAVDALEAWRKRQDD